MSIVSKARLVLTEEFQQALAYLADGKNLFLTGRAGTGKSTLIRHYLSNTQRKAIVAAPTGIAALNVNGYTIHRLFSFNSGITVEHVRSEEYYPRRFAKTLKQIDTLVIDEASMVRADLFDCLAVALERFGPRPGEPFGGVQLVLVGDLYQLPPVVTERELEYFTTRYDTPYFFSADEYRPLDFPQIELTTIFRQVGDTDLIDILNATREGTLLEEARAKLNLRTDTKFESPEEEFWLTLTTTNRIANARNKEKLELLSGLEVQHVATSTGDLDGFDAPTDDVLTFKPGAQIMLLSNDPRNRWVNGTMGKVVGSAPHQGEIVVTIELNDGSNVDITPHTWEITRPTVIRGALQHDVIGTYTQLPFRLAWAITIHKSQGQTLDRLVVDLSGGTFAFGQLYVALSRCTSMQGLVLRQGVQPKDLKVDQRIRRFLQSGKAAKSSRGPVYVGIRFVGDSGRMWRPRPVEIALVSDDGLEVTTLINPERDLGDSQSTYSISATDLQLAPLLAEAWPVLAESLEGRTPVGINIDVELGYLDYELKRNGQVVSFPLGVDLDGTAVPRALEKHLESGSALDRARSIQKLAHRHSATTTYANDFGGPTENNGYLMSRAQTADRFTTCDRGLDTVTQNAILALHLKTALGRISPTEQTLALLKQVEAHLGQEIIPQDHISIARPQITDILVPGARVCFTGSATDSSGSPLSRSDLEATAEAAGLIAVPNVTKSKCEALISADVGSQSGKAKNALKFNKPIFDVETFIQYTRGELAAPAPDRGQQPVVPETPSPSESTVPTDLSIGTPEVLPGTRAEIDAPGVQDPPPTLGTTTRRKRRDASPIQKAEPPHPAPSIFHATENDGQITLDAQRASSWNGGSRPVSPEPVHDDKVVSSTEAKTPANGEQASPIEVAAPLTPTTFGSKHWLFHIIMAAIFLFLTVGMLIIGAVVISQNPNSETVFAFVAIAWLLGILLVPVWIVWGILRRNRRRSRHIG